MSTHCLCPNLSTLCHSRLVHTVSYVWNDTIFAFASSSRQSIATTDDVTDMYVTYTCLCSRINNHKEHRKAGSDFLLGTITPNTHHICTYQWLDPEPQVILTESLIIPISFSFMDIIWISPSTSQVWETYHLASITEPPPSPRIYLYPAWHSMVSRNMKNRA